MEPALSSLIDSAERGERPQAEALFATLYSELHRLASRQLAQNAGVSLGASSLLHEAYLDMSQRAGTTFPDRGRFMAYAARVMRGLIIDHARHRRTRKRGAQFEIMGLDLDQLESAVDSAELERLGAAVEELATVEPALAQIVDLKYFCGFSFLEIAAMLGVTDRTVQRHWAKARIFLHRSIHSTDFV
ncbi:MAG: ECF-type sigma factor [Thermoanaerobaculia bacterium]